jgi:hypothetical protein
MDKVQKSSTARTLWIVTVMLDIPTLIDNIWEHNTWNTLVAVPAL